MTLGDIIVNYCRDHAMSKRQFAIQAGLSSGYISMLIANVNPTTGKPMKPTLETYQSIANVIGMSLDELFEVMDDAPVTLRKGSSVELFHMDELERHKIPLIGSVAGGEPIYDEETDLYIMGNTKATCAVRLKGQSMEPTYMDGDIIYIREQPNVRDGQIAVVFLDEEAVLKRVYHEDNGLSLLSDNREYRPIKATPDTYNSIRILGVPCGFTRMYE